jgi:hypothetical protein
MCEDTGESDDRLDQARLQRHADSIQDRLRVNGDQDYALKRSASTGGEINSQMNLHSPTDQVCNAMTRSSHITNFSKMFWLHQKSQDIIARAYAANLSGEEVDFPSAKAAVRPHHSPDALDSPAMR